MKRYLADTHAVLWYAAGDGTRLGRAARRAFDGLASGRTSISVSVVSLWEIALLHDEGNIRLAAGFSRWCDAFEGIQGIALEPLLRRDVEEARGLRTLRDPHDRLIAGTALRLGVPLLTADRRLRAESRLSTMW